MGTSFSDKASWQSVSGFGGAAANQWPIRSRSEHVANTSAGKGPWSGCGHVGFSGAVDTLNFEQTQDKVLVSYTYSQYSIYLRLTSIQVTKSQYNAYPDISRYYLPIIGATNEWDIHFCMHDTGALHQGRVGHCDEVWTRVSDGHLGDLWVASGELTKNYGKSPFLMGKPWENHGKMMIYMDNHHF